MKKRRKKLLPVDTPDSSVLSALHNRMVHDLEIMERMGMMSSKEKRKYPIEELKKGVEWLEWLSNEKKNEERRIALQEREDDELGEEGDGVAEVAGEAE